ncbi:hypothetical protein HGA88_02445 [Candidatus Roizmanbacteria bacterium]|nr:hypothetical protein [Candidatus Roizmanbacteria bacterium]
MRRISQEGKTGLLQLLILLGGSFLYFYLSERIRPHQNMASFRMFLVFLLLYGGTIAFFFFYAQILGGRPRIKSLIATYTYSLLPTFYWFFGNAVLYILIPPPRTPSLPGMLLSIVFIAYSFSLFFWKFMLLYLTLRFSTKLLFYRMMFVLLLYSTIMAGISFILYKAQIFRVPFV